MGYGPKGLEEFLSSGHERALQVFPALPGLAALPSSGSPRRGAASPAFLLHPLRTPPCSKPRLPWLLLSRGFKSRPCTSKRKPKAKAWRLEVGVVRPSVAILSALALHSRKEAVSSLLKAYCSRRCPSHPPPPPPGPAPHTPLSFSTPLPVQV